MVVPHRAQQKESHFAGATEADELARVGQGTHRVLNFLESGVKPRFELFERDVGRVAFVERGEGQLELGTWNSSNVIGARFDCAST